MLSLLDSAKFEKWSLDACTVGGGLCLRIQNNHLRKCKPILRIRHLCNFTLFVLIVLNCMNLAQISQVFRVCVYVDGNLIVDFDLKNPIRMNVEYFCWSSFVTLQQNYKIVVYSMRMYSVCMWFASAVCWKQMKFQIQYVMFAKWKKSASLIRIGKEFAVRFLLYFIFLQYFKNNILSGVVIEISRDLRIYFWMNLSTMMHRCALRTVQHIRRTIWTTLI